MVSETAAGAAKRDPSIYNGDELDLRQLVRALWRYRWIVVVLSLVSGLAGVTLSVLSEHYRSEGLFLTPAKMELGSLKRYEAAWNNPVRLQEFIDLNQLSGTQTEKLLRQLADSPGLLAEAVQPVFSLTGRDVRTYDLRTTQGAGELIGVRLSLSRQEVTPETPLQSLAEYLRHTMIQVDLEGAALQQCLLFQTRDQELRNAQLQSDFDVSQLQARAERLRELITRIPGAAAVDLRQVSSLEGGGERYLSPATQLVAVEIGITEAELASRQRARDLVSAGLFRTYYCKARELMAVPRTGRQLLDALQALQGDVFKGQDMSIDIVEQTANQLAIELAGWRNNYLEQVRFVVPPEGTEQRKRKPGLISGALFGGILGGGIGVLIALGLAWWHDNREGVLSADEA